MEPVLQAAEDPGQEEEEASGEVGALAEWVARVVAPDPAVIASVLSAGTRCPIRSAHRATTWLAPSAGQLWSESRW